LWCSPKQHADQLLEWVHAAGFTGRSLLAADLKRMHKAMCIELNWMGRPWNPIAREICKMTTGRKVYARVPAGGRRKRVYPIAPRKAAKLRVVA